MRARTVLGRLGSPMRHDTTPADSAKEMVAELSTCTACRNSLFFSLARGGTVSSSRTISCAVSSSSVRNAALPRAHSAGYSTEHNLDAYAFYNILYEVTGDERYAEAREDLFEWIMIHAADWRSGHFKRGKGDATIATDTFSWSIAAIGPGRLFEVEFDPEGIMDFAEEHCRVTVDYHRPDGKTVQITGFDFAKPQHLARGGIVSSEWTAQAVVAFRILAEYFNQTKDPEKAAYYQNKVHFYLNELQKMVISSASRIGQGKGCLPYSTMPNTDTGHGWRTPNGDKTGSVAGTAYGIFAWLGFNPFNFSENQPMEYVPASST